MSGYGIISVQVVGYTHAVSGDENRVLEFLGAAWGKLLNGTGRPSIRIISEGAIVRIIPQKMLLPARTQEARRIRLDSERGNETNGYEPTMGNIHVGVILRVLYTIAQ